MARIGQRPIEEGLHSARPGRIGGFPLPGNPAHGGFRFSPIRVGACFGAAYAGTMPLMDIGKFGEVEVRSRADLRAWLSESHDKSTSVWLVTWKKHTDHYVPFGELVEELLCWGWVDSRTRGVDADRSSVLIAPRNPKSAWSAVNKAKVEAARAAGAMTPAGEALIAAAQAGGMWNFLDDVERLERPGDLEAALGMAGLDAWDAWPRSVRRGALEWIKTAKTEPTREKRIAEVAAAAREGRRPAPFSR